MLIATALEIDDRYGVILNQFLERRIDAAFCVQPPPLSGAVARYQKSGVPIMALLQRSPGHDELPLLSIRFEGHARRIFDRLHHLGHRRGVLIFRHGGADRAEEFRTAAKQARIDIRIEASGTARGTPEYLVESIRAGRERASFVVAAYGVAKNLAELCARQGLQVPGDLSIVSVASDPSSDSRTPAISTLQLDFRGLGIRAGQAMLEWLQGMPPGEVEALDLGRWVDGESIGPVERSRWALSDEAPR